MIATLEGHLSVVELLVSKGAQLNSQTKVSIIILLMDACITVTLSEILRMLSFRPLGNLRMDFSKSAPMHVQRTTMISTHAWMPPLDNVIVDLVVFHSVFLHYMA